MNQTYRNTVSRKNSTTYLTTNSIILWENKTPIDVTKKKLKYYIKVAFYERRGKKNLFLENAYNS